MAWGRKILGGDFLEKSNQGSNREQQFIDLDQEWVHLLLAAKKAGIKADEIRQFFHEKTVQIVQ
ncbi:hypothetical protein CD191_01985 [Paenibacillus odorifer]|uniref:Sin domain-containing protein n=1 Tax=Paenibacillus odorifer TaxID=189426 RepID=A0AAD0KNS0_9BACL|nr:hypothetical protein CD191_01985 [Paenibacillus odorifer]OZQ74382.1 hypothetical protein CA596_17670 [Paenibacillus odorifer]